VRVSFELESGEGVQTGIRRIVDEQLADALEELRRDNPRKVDEAVHSARKRLKRVRAVARLVRKELGNEVYQRENTAFRDAGATLSEARDAAVLVQTLDGLKGRVDAEAFAAARKVLVARRRAVHQRVIEQGNGLAGVAQAVEEARQRVSQWPIERDGWRALRPGLRRIYADGRQAMKLAKGGTHEEVFHEWRKQVKHLWHQLEIVEPVWPEVIKALADECHALADLLGQEHDLAVLRDVLKTESPSSVGAGSSVDEAIQTSRADLQRQALSLGARVFAEKPKAFVRRIGQYWHAWKDQSAEKPQEQSSDAAMAAAEDTPAVPAEDQHEGGGTEQAAGSDGNALATSATAPQNGAA
jgi:CHAD domain-containing protein